MTEQITWEERYIEYMSRPTEEEPVRNTEPSEMVRLDIDVVREILSELPAPERKALVRRMTCWHPSEPIYLLGMMEALQLRYQYSR